MIEQLPILLVIIPLLAAPVCALMPGRGLACYRLAASTAAATLVIAAMLWAQVHQDATIASYPIGGWAPPWGIEYRIDRLNTQVLLLITLVSTLILAGCRDSVAREIAAERQPLFYSCVLLCLTGLLGMTATGDAFNIFVFLEISSLSSYALIAMGHDRRALAASFQYLMMGTIGATFILIGIGFLYMVTGTLNMHDLATRIPQMTDSRTVHAAFAFLTVGLALKVALFPLHLWLPNAYAHAPSMVSALLAATSTKVSLYVLLRFVYSVFGTDYSFGILQIHLLLAPLSVIAIFAASIVAVYQSDVKKLLAYSSVAQIGYMTLAVSIGTEEGAAAAIVHLFNHGLMKATLFMALAAIMLQIGSSRVADMSGLFRRMPWTATCMALGALSLAGVPLTAGFVSKWALLSAALHRDAWLLAVMVVLSSLIALYYVWRILEPMFLRRPPAQAETVSDPPLRTLAPLAMLALANVVFGLHTELNLHGAVWAAEALFEP